MDIENEFKKTYTDGRNEWRPEASPSDVWKFVAYQIGQARRSGMEEAIDKVMNMRHHRHESGWMISTKEIEKYQNSLDSDREGGNRPKQVKINGVWVNDPYEGGDNGKGV